MKVYIVLPLHQQTDIIGVFKHEQDAGVVANDYRHTSVLETELWDDFMEYDVDKRRAMVREQALAKLTLEEREALGVA